MYMVLDTVVHCTATLYIAPDGTLHFTINCTAVTLYIEYCVLQENVVVVSVILMLFTPNYITVEKRGGILRLI